MGFPVAQHVHEPHAQRRRPQGLQEAAAELLGLPPWAPPALTRAGIEGRLDAIEEHLGGERAAARERLVEAARALEPLVDEWQTLVQAGRWERFPGQLARVLSDLGALPPADDGVYVM